MNAIDDPTSGESEMVSDLLAPYLQGSGDDLERKGPSMFLASSAATMVSFERESGDLLALPYHQLSSITLDGRGLGPLVLQFANRKIELGGQELAGLYREFLAHRVARVIETSAVTEEDILSGVPLVRSIST